MNKLLPTIQREFPGFEAVSAFDAGIPAYYVLLDIEVLEPQRLTHFQSYFLHALALGITTREEMAYFLGVDDQDLIVPAAGLLKLEYIQQVFSAGGKGRSIMLTAKGQQALSEQGAPPVPLRKTGHLHFNALTWMPTSLEENTISAAQMSKEGFPLLPAKERQRPTIGDFTEQEVGLALRGATAFQDRKIVELLELRKVESEYIAPVTVVLLKHPKTNEQRLVVYEGSSQRREDSTALQRLFENGDYQLPTEVTSLSEHHLDLPLHLSPEILQATQILARNEQVLEELEAQLTEQEERKFLSQSEMERQELRQRVQQLKEELQIKREDNEGLREKLFQSKIDFLRTEDHRAVLKRALREVREELIIISPWMNRRACDDELCQLLGKALSRGVRIRIGYGIGQERSKEEAERNRNNVRAVTNAIKRFTPKSAIHLLEMRETRGTHEKILVCDRQFAVSSSFNWLSYAGGQDKGYRSETGILLRAPDQVADLATKALQTLLS
jgi:hypothetical protein